MPWLPHNFPLPPPPPIPSHQCQHRPGCFTLYLNELTWSEQSLWNGCLTPTLKPPAQRLHPSPGACFLTTVDPMNPEPTGVCLSLYHRARHCITLPSLSQHRLNTDQRKVRKRNKPLYVYTHAFSDHLLLPVIGGQLAASDIRHRCDPTTFVLPISNGTRYLQHAQDSPISKMRGTTSDAHLTGHWSPKIETEGPSTHTGSSLKLQMLAICTAFLLSPHKLRLLLLLGVGLMAPEESGRPLTPLAHGKGEELSTLEKSRSPKPGCGCSLQIAISSGPQGHDTSTQSQVHDADGLQCQCLQKAARLDPSL